MLVYGQRYIEDNAPAKKGGMGSVVQCTDPHLDRKVAIKFLQAGTDERRLTDEVRALQQIRSKHVVQVYDIVHSGPNKELGIVQEWLPGDDLKSFPTKAPSPDDYLKVLYQLASGLEEIHQHNIIHRDFKPNNVKYDAEGILTIFDFGLSRSEDDGETVGFRGTHGYAAPELYGDKVTFTTAVDVYAFGATALFLAKGSLPDEMKKTKPPNGELWAVNHGFGTLAMQIPSRVAHVLNQCLATDPALRPKMTDIRRLIGRRLVQGQHRALLVHDLGDVFCDKSNPNATLTHPGVAQVTIEYTKLQFAITAFTGDVYVNNVKVQQGKTVIPTSCVITLGSDISKRSFITIDLSRPEVVL